MPANTLPPCGLYRTTADVGDVPAGRLVYFHNHGEPGPGIYLPEAWELNRARFAQRGFTLPEPYARSAEKLAAVPAEGFYRVKAAFHCCEKKCRSYEPGLFVQLGYDGSGSAILFVPELSANGIVVPTTGSAVQQGRLSNLEPMTLAHRHDEAVKRGISDLH